jgi:hypothetical protein
MIAVALSSARTSWLRYSRSWGLWLLLLVAPVGARFMLPRDGGGGVVIALGDHLPVMTSAMLGVSLGIVVSTLLLPIGFLYLRANTTRRQPWQIEEVTPASRIAIALGRFAADVAVLFAMLAALNLAGWVLGALLVERDTLNLWQISLALWLVAGPAVMGLAALRILFDALPWTRRGLGEFVYFCFWIGSIAMVAAADHDAPGFATNMYDFAGFMQPLKAGAPAGSTDFAIGGVDHVLPGKVYLDVMAGLRSPGYVASRFAWAAIAVLVAAFAGLVYRPHRAPRRVALPGRLTRWLAPGAPPAANPAAPPAPHARLAWVNLIVAEFRLIGAGRLFALLAAAAAVAGLMADYRHIGSPAALLLLIFALCAHAGRSEARGLLTLTRVAPLSPWLRRAAFVAASIGWAMAIAAPGALWHADVARLATASTTTAATAIAAIALAAFSGSGFAPRLVLLIAWYIYLST